MESQYKVGEKMLDKISLNIGIAILSGLAIIYVIWSNYRYSTAYTSLDWISIVFLILLILLCIYRESTGKT